MCSIDGLPRRDWQSLGRLATRELPIDWGLQAKCVWLTWTPAPGLFHCDVNLPVQIYMLGSTQGTRWFTLNWQNVDVTQALLIHAERCGAVMSCRVEGLVENKHETNILSALFLNRSQNTKAFQTRRFRGPKDTSLDAAQRSEVDRNEVIPYELAKGRFSSKFGTVARLRAAGRDLAEALHCPIKGFEEELQFGLWAAAREMDPIPPEKAPAVVRLALFGLSMYRDVEIDDELECLVTDAFYDAIRRLHTDPIETAEQFAAWHRGPHNALAEQLRKQVRSARPDVDRQSVKACLERLRWKAHAICAQNATKTFRSLASWIDPPLTEREQRQFEQLFCAVPQWGGLSLPMLWPRYDQLRPAFADGLIEKAGGDGDLSGHALRLLQFYGEMAQTRKDADNIRYRAKRERQGFDGDWTGESLKRHREEKTRQLRLATTRTCRRKPTET